MRVQMEIRHAVKVQFKRYEQTVKKVSRRRFDFQPRFFVGYHIDFLADPLNNFATTIKTNDKRRGL